MRLPALILAMLAASPLAAQDLIYTDNATLACVNAAADVAGQQACIGTSANQCMEATPMGGTTVGMGGCLDKELTFWDGVLNATYQTALTRARGMDAENAGLNAHLPKLETTLREMQRTWIPYRDATCDFERAQWGGGTGGGPATLSCLMRLTGAQALYLNNAWLGQ